MVKRFEKARLLTLLEKIPDQEKSADDWGEWFNEVKTELNELLGIYNDSEQVYEKFQEIKEEFEEVWKTIKNHRHLPNGEVTELL